MITAEQIQKEAEEMFPYTILDLTASIARLFNKMQDELRGVYIAGATRHAELNIEFADWCEDNYWSTAEKGIWRENHLDDHTFTTQELYQLFLNDKNKVK